MRIIPAFTILFTIFLVFFLASEISYNEIKTENITNNNSNRAYSSYDIPVRWVIPSSNVPQPEITDTEEDNQKQNPIDYTITQFDVLNFLTLLAFLILFILSFGLIFKYKEKKEKVKV